LTDRKAAIGQLQILSSLGDEEALPDWNLFEVLSEDFRPKKDAVERVFKGEVFAPFFLARHARKMLILCCGDNRELEGLTAGLEAIWAEKLELLQQDTHNRQAAHESLARRYEEALERRRLASGLPDANDLDRIQRYEAHLERGLHKDLDRLHDLKAARGAVPPRGPSVAVAVVQAPKTAPIGSFAVEVPEGEMASFGSFAVEAPEGEMAQDPAGTDGQG
jgi:hypothetical protein